MGKAKIDFMIDPEIFTTLLKLQEKLPSIATGENKKDAEAAYEHPAGMTLLGMKDNLVDTVIPLHMSGGCWDAPNINYDDMDKGLRKLIEADRICAGMSLLRHPLWKAYSEHDNARIPSHLKSQLHGLRNSFEDITKTIWIIVHHDYFRVYRPSMGEGGRVGLAEISAKNLFPEDAKDNTFISNKFEKDKTSKELLIEKRAARKAELERRKKEAEEEIKRAEAEEAKRIKKMQEKKDALNTKLKESKESIVDAGGGYVFMKTKEGKYILWQTGR